MKQQFKIGVICLANGPYSVFIDPLIESCENKFLINHKKEYFIITDGVFIHAKDDNCTVIYKDRLGYPMDCTIRHQYAYELEEKTSHLDFVYFFNANIIVHTEVREEVLPDESGLVGLEHPLAENQQNKPYEGNIECKAYIPSDKGKTYYQACLWGGKTEAFMELSKVCSEWTKEDLGKGISPIWFDESYLNKYFFLHVPKTLSFLYGYPAGFQDRFPLTDNVKIIQLQKQDHLPKDFKYKK